MHALAIEGTFDDCQAIVKGLFNHHAFRDRVRLSGVNSINWARIVAQVVYYFTAAVALGAPHRKVAFTVPTGNFGDVFAGYVAERMGLPIDRLVVATNVNDILARTLKTGTYEVRDVLATASPSMDIQVSSNFERLLFDAYGRDAAAVRALMGSLAQSRRFSIAPGPLTEIRSRFAAERADEEETAATIRTVHRETGSLIDPHTAVAVAVAEKESRDRTVPMVVLSTAHPAKFPDAVEGRQRDHTETTRLARRPRRAPGARHRAAGGSGRGRTIHQRGEPCRARRSRRMTMDVTRLPSGLVVVTDAMPHLQSASLGVWVGSGSRDEHPGRARHLASARTHGVQGHRAPHRAPDRRGDRGGRRRSQRRDQRRDHGLLCRAC